jgi:hypothetical protein
MRDVRAAVVLKNELQDFIAVDVHFAFDGWHYASLREARQNAVTSAISLSKTLSRIDAMADYSRHEWY